MKIKMNYLLKAALPAIVLLSSVASFSQEDNSRGAPEVWGGDHVSMVMSSQSTTFEFDCAQGVVMSPIKAESDGDFTVTGTYTPQRGGPIKKDSPPADLPATYKGTIHGDTMTVEVLLENKSQQPPPLTLKRGQTGRVTKCR
jgi:hypothetical protein